VIDIQLRFISSGIKQKSIAIGFSQWIDMKRLNRALAQEGALTEFIWAEAQVCIRWLVLQLKQEGIDIQLRFKSSRY